MNTNVKPGWVTAVGIIAIVLSGFGVLGGLQESLTPVMIDAQRAEYEMIIEEFNSMTAEGEQQLSPEDQQIIDMMSSFAEFFEKILNMPEWYLNWLIVSGIISMLIHGFYLFAAIGLMQLKPHAPRFLATALPLSIALAITRTTIAVQALGGMAFFMMGGTLIALLIEVVLLIVLLTKDKSVFKQFEA